MIRLTSNLLNRLIEYCKAQLPNEACGVFYGIIAENYILIKQFVPVANSAKQPRIHFEFEREHLIQLLYKPPDTEVKWIGIFHSHPFTAAYPSLHDLQILWDLPVYAILSLQQPDIPILKSYEIIAGKQKKPNSIKELAIEIIME